MFNCTHGDSHRADHHPGHILTLNQKQNKTKIPSENNKSQFINKVINQHNIFSCVPSCLEMLLQKFITLDGLSSGEGFLSITLNYVDSLYEKNSRKMMSQPVLSLFKMTERLPVWRCCGNGDVRECGCERGWSSGKVFALDPERPGTTGRLALASSLVTRTLFSSPEP